MIDVDPLMIAPSAGPSGASRAADGPAEFAAAMASAEEMVAGERATGRTADDTATKDPAVERRAVERSAVEDSAVEDISLEDSALQDTAAEDISLEDGAVEDISLDDTAVEDIAVEDVAVEDIAVEDGAVDETLPEDTATGAEIDPAALAATSVVPPSAGSAPNGDPAVAAGEAGSGATAAIDAGSPTLDVAAEAVAGGEAEDGPSLGAGTGEREIAAGDATGTADARPVSGGTLAEGTAFEGTVLESNSSERTVGGATLDPVGAEVAATDVGPDSVDGATPEPTMPTTPAAAPADTASPRVQGTSGIDDPGPVAPRQTATTTPATQLAEALRDVRTLVDGSHRLSLALHPEELGAVQLEIAVRDGRLHVRAVAETEAARAALEQGLPELRANLRDAGVRAGSLEVGPDASGRDRSDATPQDSRPGARRAATPESPTPTTTVEPTTESGLDIRL